MIRSCFVYVETVYELMERVAYYGITANLVLYMKNKFHFGSASAARNVNEWLGATTVLPIFGAFIADTYWGKYRTIVYLSGFYVLVSRQKTAVYTGHVLATVFCFWVMLILIKNLCSTLKFPSSIAYEFLSVQ